MFARKPVPDLRDRLINALANLLVRLHLDGFYWGDCSLSNTLFRRDAHKLAAYVVDVETGELHDQLSDGQRLHDLDVAQENIAGELLDLEAELGDLDLDDPFELATEVAAEYERIWNELMAEEDFRADERDRLQERLKRLNERGFDVEEVELEATDDGYHLRIRPQVVEAGHYRRRLLKLTGLEAQENQARRLLEDIESFRASLKASGQEPVSDTAAAGRWLTDVFEPTVVKAIPEDLHGKRAAAQVFHELLEHRWHLSEQAGRDVGMDEAVDSYVENVLRAAPEERVIVEETRRASAGVAAPCFWRRYARYGSGSMREPTARSSVSCGVNFRPCLWMCSPSHSRSGANSPRSSLSSRSGRSSLIRSQIWTLITLPSE